MKKHRQSDKDELRSEYPTKLIKTGVRGKYAAKYRAGTNLVPLEADVAKAFPTPEAVNDALRLLITVAKSARRRADAAT
jgi:hypothetical protein